MNNLIAYPVSGEGYKVEIFVDKNYITRIEALEEAEKEIRREIMRAKGK